MIICFSIAANEIIVNRQSHLWLKFKYNKSSHAPTDVPLIQVIQQMWADAGSTAGEVISHHTLAPFHDMSRTLTTVNIMTSSLIGQQSSVLAPDWSA